MFLAHAPHLSRHFPEFFVEWPLSAQQAQAHAHVHALLLFVVEKSFPKRQNSSLKNNIISVRAESPRFSNN